MRVARWWVVTCGVVAVAAGAQEVQVAPRASSAADLTPRFERFVTSNGLVVLLSPDPRTNAVLVDLSFAAGALHQPPGKAGLAHLAEHVFSSGPTPQTDYRGLLERRGATGFNAFTTLDRLSFRVTVPPEELPLALWANADRLGSVSATVTEAGLRRHQRIVAQERVHRIDDSPYGGNAVAVMRSLFPEGHPLRSGVIGGRDEIHALTVADVLGFARTHFVPANGVLVVVGNFDPAVARAWVEKAFGALPPGEADTRPFAVPGQAPDVRVSVTEELGRRPKVTLAWSLAGPMTEVSEALAFGSLLLTIYTDGFVGMDVSASYLEFTGGGVFTLEVTMPHALDKLEASGNAEVVFRYLSRAVMPRDIVAATLLAWDRELMARLHTREGLASMLVLQECLPHEPLHELTAAERHWALTPDRIQAITGSALRGTRVTVLSKPTRPLPRKVSP